MERDAAKQPWDRLEAENERAYNAFQLYRDLPAIDRTVQKAYYLYKRWTPESGKPAPVISGTFGGYSRRFQWHERAVAWDQHLVQIRDQSSEHAAEASGSDWIKRQDELREASWQRAWQAFEKAQKFLDMEIETGKLTPWALQAIMVSLQAADRLARLAAGLETDRKAAEGAAPGTPGSPGQPGSPGEVIRLVPRHDLLLRDPESLTDDELNQALATTLTDDYLARLIREQGQSDATAA